MKTLIIAEKPSVAADIARALGNFTRKGDVFENDTHVVASALGHLVELFMPEDIDKKYAFWRLESLPIVPDKFQLKPIERTEDKFRELVKLIKRKDVHQIVNACDAGREGELIFQYIYELSGSSKAVQRLWMSSMTADGIRAAFRDLRPGLSMQPLADAARSRSEADWLIGINATRAVTRRMFGARKGAMATIGRVQTPTLAIVVAREREIRAFQPRAYSRVLATFRLAAGDYEGVYQRPGFRKGDDPEDRADRLWERATAEAVLAAVRGGGPAAVSEESRRSTQAPPRLFDLTTLQREANNRYGFPARRTLQIAQALYERHKVLTYPRTDSRALPEDYLGVVREVLGILPDPIAPHARRVLDNQWIRPNKRIFDNASVSDHFAIIPTTTSPQDLDEAEWKIYELVARRLVAVFYPPAEFDVTVRTSTVAGHSFRSEGKVLVSPGWLQVYGRTTLDDSERSLPPLLGDDGVPPVAEVIGADIKDEVTRPPARYTEATLLSAMENAGKLVDDEDLADAMKEKGLGTPATRAAIIEHLISEKYIHREGRELVPTAKAENVLEFLSHVKCDELTSPALTGDWEFELRRVEQGKVTRTAFMRDIIALTRKIVDNIRNYEDSREAARTLSWCSFTDHMPMLEYDRMFASQDGKVEIYKTVGNRRLSEEEAQQLVECKRLGPIDDFVSEKSGRKFSAILELREDEKGAWRPRFVFDVSGSGGSSTVNFDALEPIGRCPRTGHPIYATPTQYVVRTKEGGTDKLLFRLPRNLLGREIPLEQYLRYLEHGKTELIDKFWSRRTRRPFSAVLVMKPDGSGFDFSFPAREGGAANDEKGPRKQQASPAPTEKQSPEPAFPEQQTEMPKLKRAAARLPKEPATKALPEASKARTKKGGRSRKVTKS